MVAIKRPRKVGAALDVGSHSVRYVEMDVEQGTVRKAWHRVLHRDRQQVHEDLDGEPLQQRLTALTGLLQAEGPSPAGVVMALQGPGTWVHYLDFPALQDEELKVAAQAAAARAVPFALERTVLSTTPVPALHPGRSGVLLVAALREPAARWSRLLAASGVTVTRMEVVPLALARAFGRNHPERAGGFSLIASLGFSLSHLVAVRDGLPYLVRELPLGTRHLVQALQVAAGLTWADAESALEHTASTAVRRACTVVRDAWLVEVEQTARHFAARLAGSLVEAQRVWLMGGGAALPGAQGWQAATPLELVLERPVALRWELSPADEVACGFQAAVGMALEP